VRAFQLHNQSATTRYILVANESIIKQFARKDSSSHCHRSKNLKSQTHSLPYSQGPAISSWPEPTNSNQHSHIVFAKYRQRCYLKPCLISGNWRLTPLVFRIAQCVGHWLCIKILLNVKHVVKTRRLRAVLQVNEVCIWNARETSQRTCTFHNKKCHQLQINTILPCCVFFWLWPPPSIRYLYWTILAYRTCSNNPVYWARPNFEGL